MGALESGKSIAEQILAKLPESLRGQVKSVFDAPEAVDALTLLGDTTLARADYSRQMDDIKKKSDELEATRTQLNADYTNLNTWYADNKAALDEFGRIKPEYEKLKGTPNPNPNPNPAPAPTQGISKEDMEKMLQARDAGYAAVLGVTTTLAARHMKDFNEPLDVNTLIEHATKNRVPLFDPRAETDAYRAIHGEKLTAKAKAEEDARINKLAEERFAELRKNQTQPYPVHGGPEPSVLDTLTSQPDPNRFTVDAAARHYEELVAANQAGR